MSTQDLALERFPAAARGDRRRPERPARPNRRRPGLGGAFAYAAALAVASSLWLVTIARRGAHAVVIGGALAGWAFALGATDAATMTDLGLISVLPASYYVALGVLCLGFTRVAWHAPQRSLVLAGYLGAVLLVLHGTPPLLYDAPQYTWTYKHLAVTDLLSSTGAVDRSLDIYNNWPGFFAVTGWLQSVAGTEDLIGAAGWAPLFFNVVNVVAVQFALRGVTAQKRLIWPATLLFALGNWIGADYYSPQALAFPMALLVIGICIRSTSPRAVPKPLRRLLARLTGRELATFGVPAPEAMLRPRVALTVGALTFAALVVTHQLSPPLVIASVAALLVVRRLPIRVPLAMVVAEAAWVWLAWPYLSERFGLVNAQGVSLPEVKGPEPLPGMLLEAKAANLLCLALLGLAVVGFIRLVRAGRLELWLGAVIVAPFVVVMLQAYGGEGIMRAYLFALPWMALLAAVAFLGAAPDAARRRRLKPGRLAMAPAVLAIGGLFMIAHFGLEYVNQVTSSDIAAVRWYEEQNGSSAIGLAPSFPAPLSERYPDVYRKDIAVLRTLTDAPEMAAADTAQERVGVLAGLASWQEGTDVFLLITPSQRHYALMQGLMSEEDLARLDRALATSQDFDAQYSDGASTVYRYTGPRITTDA
jgi:hypothetical protein